MKKFFKIFIITVVLLLAVIVALPFVFQGKIINIIKQEINKSLNAKVDFKHANLSLIRNFPDFSLKIKKLNITGNSPFESDTLILVDNTTIVLDLFSVFRGSPYEIKKVVLNSPDLRLLVLEDGSVNWDILLPDEISDETSADEDELLVLNIKDMRVTGGNVVYDDKELEFIMKLDNLEGNISGDLSAGISNLLIEAEARELIMIYENTTYMSGVKADYKGLFKLDLDKDYYTMHDNRIYLNGLGIDVNGGFGFVDEDIILDIDFKSKDDNFKSLLSLVPVIYARDFEKVKTDGKFTLNGFVKGLYGDNLMPGFGLEVNVNEASFSYPDLPENIKNISLNANVQNKTGVMDDLSIDIARFDFTIAENPVITSFYLKNPVSDPNVKASFSGKINLASLADVIPLEPEESLKGVVDFGIKFAGKVSDIEESHLSQVDASGFLALSDIDYHSSTILLPLEIHNARFDFSPVFLQLSDFEIKMGNSLIQLDGRIDNYLAYYLNNEYLKGSLNLNAGILNINEILSAMPSDTTAEVDTLDSAIQIPDFSDRVEFVFNAKADRIVYENYNLTNSTANIVYKDKLIRFESLKAEMLAGNVEMKGVFDARDVNAAMIDMDFRMNTIDIAQAYSSISMIQMVAPVAEKTRGSMSTGFKLKGVLDKELNPKYETLFGGGSLQTSDLTIESVQVMDQLATLLGNNDYKRLVTDGINFAFEIVNGKVFQKPFTIKYGGTNTTFGGYVGFDKQINYDFIFQIPYEKLGLSQAVKNLSEAASKKGIKLNPGSNLNVNAKLTGALISPKIELDYKDAVVNLQSELEDAARQELQKQKEEALKKVSEEAQKVLDEAHRKSEQLIAQAENTAASIRAEANVAAEKIRTEAENQAKRLEEEGKKKGKVAELAAKEAAKKVRQEGENTAQKLIREADKKAENIVNQAKQQADGIINKAQQEIDKI